MEPALPLRLGDRYLLEAKIGAGGAAVVYRARDLEGGGLVAVKVANRREATREEHYARFEREAAVLSVIASDHVVRVIAAGRSVELAGAPYLVMELLEGADLEQALRTQRSVAARDVVGWLRQAARALDLAHGVGLVHRDLKPSNLFLEKRGRLKVLDFGLVKLLHDERPDDPLLGTPLFMAPEQVRGQSARVGPATDVWAVGMLAVHLLTGEAYWRGATLVDILGEIDSAPMPAPSSRWPWIPAAFDEWFRRACDRTAARRFPSVGAQITALARALADVTGELVPAGAPEGTASSHLSLVAPLALTRRLIGRIAERRELARRLATSVGALVTITGPGGIGKSALAEHVVNEIAGRFDGAFRVLLDEGASGSELAAALARQLGVAAVDLAAALGERRALVWIDGLERAKHARGLIGSLRARGPRVTWLVTSRMPLALPGEELLVLPPLDIPAAGTVVSHEEARRYDAVALFSQRASEVAPGFTLRPGDVEDAAALVRAAGGIPLAIELAAAQLRELPLSAVRARFAAGLGQGGTPLGAAITGSLATLAADERAIMGVISLAAGGLSADEIAALTEAGDPTGALGVLAGRGLVYPIGEEPVRWAMLPPVRELAARVLDEPDLVRRRWLALLAEAAEGDFGHRLDDATEALTWALENDPPAALRLAAALADVWYLRGHYAEGSRWLARALAVGVGPTLERRRALQGAGRLAFLQCRYQDAEELLAEAAALARQLGDEAGLASADQLLGSIARERGDYTRAHARHEASRRRWLRLGNLREEARAWSYLAFAAWLAGKGDAAMAVDEAAARLEELDDDSDEDQEIWVWIHLNRGAIALHAGRTAEAERELVTALDVATAVRFQEGIAWALELRGRAALGAGDVLHADARLRAALRVHARLDDRWRSASVLEALGLTALRDGDGDQAAFLIGAAEMLRARMGTPVPACERPALDEAGPALAAHGAARLRGRRSRFAEVIAQVLGSGPT